MNTSIVERALRRTGQLLSYHRDVEILLVGGAAGMVTGLLAPQRVTADCDVMVTVPPDAMGDIADAAARVAEEMRLPPTWLNSDAQIRVDALPDGWDSRRVHVGTYGRLYVFAASRPDLIAMKVLAGRDQDIDDLHAMRPRTDDVVFVRRYLDSLEARGTDLQQIEDARSLLDALALHEHE